MNLHQAMETITVFQNASPATLASLLSCARLCVYGKNDTIFREREETGAFYFVSQGLVYLSRLNHHQENRVIFLCREGEMLNEDLIDEKSSSASCMTLTKAWVIRIPEKDMRFLMAQDFGLCQAVMSSMAGKIRRLYHQMKNTNNSVRLEQRIASKLWKLAKDYGTPSIEGVCIPFDLSITFLADMVGSKRETVSRKVKELCELDLVQVKGKTFYIRDQKELLEFFHKS